MTEKFVDTFATHLFIEMVYGRPNGGLIKEQFIRESRDYKMLCESYGLFNGCTQIAKALTDKVLIALKNNEPSFRVVLKNQWFISVIRIVFDERVQASYNQGLSVINGKFDPLVININPNMTNFYDIRVALMHELMHGYEDWCRRANNAESVLDNQKKIGYFKNINYRNEDLTDIEKIVNKFLYRMNDTERNAYIGQIKGELDTCNLTFNSVSDVLDFLKNLPAYKRYEYVFQMGEWLCNVTDVTVQQKILDATKKMSNYGFRNYANFAKWVRDKLYNYQRKFNTMFSRMAKERLRLNEEFISWHDDFDGEEMLKILTRLTKKMNKK